MREPIVTLDELGRLSSVIYFGECKVQYIDYSCADDMVAGDADESVAQGEVAEES